MTIGNIIFLSSAVSVSLLFLIVLYWTESKTRDF